MHAVKHHPVAAIDKTANLGANLLRFRPALDISVRQIGETNNSFNPLSAFLLFVLRYDDIGNFQLLDLVFCGLGRRLGFPLAACSKQRHGDKSGKNTVRGQFSVLLYKWKLVWAPYMKHLPKSAIPNGQFRQPIRTTPERGRTVCPMREHVYRSRIQATCPSPAA